MYLNKQINISQILTHAVSFILILALLSCSSSTSSNNDINVGKEILKAMEEERIPSVSACIVKGNDIVWEGVYGYADVEQGKLANRNTIYNIESISKLFVSISIFQLWEDGLIDLDADISQYLPYDVRNPNYPDVPITTHMLLNHTSGLAWPDQSKDHLPNFEYFFKIDEVPPISEWIPQYILPDGEHYRNTVWKDFKPGTKELYSNIGASLLGLIIEEIADIDFRDYCRENILLPLGMNNSEFRLEYLNEEQLVTPYYNNNYPFESFTYRHYPAGNIKSNIPDFSRFLSAILNQGELNGVRILENETFEKMLVLQNSSTGMANLWNHRFGGRVAKYGGGTGFSCYVEWQIDNNIGFVVFSNKYNESVYPHGRIFELLRYQCNNY